MVLRNSPAAADRRPSWFLLVGGVAAAVALVLVTSPTLAGSGSRDRNNGSHVGGRGCHGLVNAYSQVLANAAGDPEAASGLVDLRAVAQKKGCDLSGATAAEHPPTKDTDDHGKPPADVVADKCLRIAAKLTVAESRPHGKSAEAFARQAEKWKCPLSK